MTHDQIKSRIVYLAARTQGVGRHEVSTMFSTRDRVIARTLMDEAEASGNLTGVIHPGQTHSGPPKSRLFLDPAHAKAWAAAPLDGVNKGKMARSRPDVAERMRAKHAANHAAGTVIRSARQPLPEQLPREQSTPIFTSETKVTICPSASVDRRYQVEPGEQVFGCGFSQLRPGQYIGEAAGLAAKALAA